MFSSMYSKIPCGICSYSSFGKQSIINLAWYKYCSLVNIFSPFFLSFNLSKYIENVIEQNRGFEARIDNINLNKNISKLEVENEKIPQAKELVYGYKKVIENKDKEIEELKNECNSLKEMLNKIPKFIKTLFLGNKKVKLLKEKNN